MSEACNERFTTWIAQKIGGSMLGEVVVAELYDAAQSEMAALREELAGANSRVDTLKSANTSWQEGQSELLKDLAGMTTYRDNAITKITRLRGELTAAEQRNATITELLRQAATYGGLTPLWHDKVQRFIKPTESGASE